MPVVSTAEIIGGEGVAIFCGTDIVSVERIKKSINDFGDTFLKRIYTDEEISYCESRRMSKFQSYAARFAAKEAVSKALGSGFRNGITLKDIEITHDKLGKPVVNLYNHALARAYFISDNQKFKIHITISNEREYANAVAVIETY